MPHCNSSEQIHGKDVFCFPFSDASRQPALEGLKGQENMQVKNLNMHKNKDSFLLIYPVS